MIAETTYICEICRSRYTTADAALKCEAQGVPGKGRYPVGMIFNNAIDPGELYHQITFAIARTGSYKHWPEDKLWACRETGLGDSLGEEMCASRTNFTLGKWDIPDSNHPTFERMVSYLRSICAYITVWDGEKPIPLNEFMEKNQ